MLVNLPEAWSWLFFRLLMFACSSGVYVSLEG